MRYLFVFFWLFSSCIALQCKLGLVIKVISSTRGHEQDLNHVAAASVMNNCCKKDRAIPPRPSHFDHISWCVHLCVLAHKSWTPSSNSLRNLSWWTLVFISDSSLFPFNFKNLNLVKGDSNQQPPAPQSTFCHSELFVSMESVNMMRVGAKVVASPDVIEYNCNCCIREDLSYMKRRWWWCIQSSLVWKLSPELLVFLLWLHVNLTASSLEWRSMQMKELPAKNLTH